MSSLPIACTLSGADMAKRLATIADLNDRALREKRRTGLTLELDYEQTARIEVMHFVTAERACCAFLTFSVEDVGDAVRVRITAPDEAQGIADVLLDSFESGRRSR